MHLRRFASASLLAALFAALSAAPSTAQQGGSRPDPNDSSAVPQPTQAMQFPLNGAWTLVSISGRPVSADRPTLVVDDQLRAKGFSGCNTYSATAYPLRDKGFLVGPIAVTRRACPGPAMAAERAFLVALRASRNWNLDQGSLVLSGGAGELRFERAL